MRDRKVRPATTTPKAFNITIIRRDGLPISMSLLVKTDGLVWNHTDAWEKICKAIVKLADDYKIADGLYVFVGTADEDGQAYPGHYTIGEIRRELA